MEIERAIEELVEQVVENLELADQDWVVDRISDMEPDPDFVIDRLGDQLDSACWEWCDRFVSMVVMAFDHDPRGCLGAIATALENEDCTDLKNRIKNIFFTEED